MQLIDLYRQLHEEGDKSRGLSPEETFPGHSLPPHIGLIKRLIEKTNAKEILDYGSGKGHQYIHIQIKDETTGESKNLIEYWDVNVSCYDPSYAPFTSPPSRKYDGVICTDVLEHCPEEDLQWIIDDIFGHAKLFVYANVACYPAKARLPNGDNAHCTIRPPEWWDALFLKIAADHPGIKWKMKTKSYKSLPDGSFREVKNVYGNIITDE